MTEEQIYRAAAQLLRDKGWFHSERNSVGIEPLCIGLAISRVCPEPVGVFSYNDNLPHLHELIGRSFVDFNDAPDMTADDAIAALEIAADLATPSPEAT